MAFTFFVSPGFALYPKFYCLLAELGLDSGGHANYCGLEKSREVPTMRFPFEAVCVLLLQMLLFASPPPVEELKLELGTKTGD